LRRTAHATAPNSGYIELGPRADTIYKAFVDPSGGSQDSMTLAIAHKTAKPEEQIVVDALREARAAIQS
jgi:hypothetical protein